MNELDAWYAILKLGAPDEGYLIAYKAENPALSSQLLRVREFRDQTAEVRTRLSDLQRIFALGYAFVMLLLLMGAVWIGFLVANAIVGPVRRLATAAQAVTSGDLASRVEVRKGDGELGELGHTFNNMTTQLQAQRDELVTAQEQSDARRRFTEAVLSGVPAGVLNIQPDGGIALANPSAERILGRPGGGLMGQTITDVAPELAPLVARAISAGGSDVSDQIELSRGGRARIINVQIKPEHPGETSGFVTTLDDITELVSAQRERRVGGCGATHRP